MKRPKLVGPFTRSALKVLTPAPVFTFRWPVVVPVGVMFHAPLPTMLLPATRFTLPAELSVPTVSVPVLASAILKSCWRITVGPVMAVEVVPPALAVTWPVKVFATLLRMTVPVPPARVEVPVTLSAPVCEIPTPVAERFPPTEPAPRFNAVPAVAVRFPPTARVPSVSAPGLETATALAPVFESETAPESALALLSRKVPAVTEVVPV